MSVEAKKSFDAKISFFVLTINATDVNNMEELWRRYSRAYNSEVSQRDAGTPMYSFFGVASRNYSTGYC